MSQFKLSSKIITSKRYGVMCRKIEHDDMAVSVTADDPIPFAAIFFASPRRETTVSVDEAFFKL
jgi:hypothetical protein